MKNRQPLAKACALAVATAVSLAAAGAAAAEPSQTQLDQQQQEIRDLRQELKELKALLLKDRAAPAPAAAQSDPAAVQATPAINAKSTSPTRASMPHEIGDAVSLTENPGGWRVIDTEKTKLGLYGMIDLTLATSSSGGPNANPNAATQASDPTKYGNTNQRWTGLDVSWMNGSRWGITGSHVIDAASDTRVVMRLESEYEPATGNFDGGYQQPVLSTGMPGPASRVPRSARSRSAVRTRSDAT